MQSGTCRKVLTRPAGKGPGREAEIVAERGTHRQVAPLRLKMDTTVKCIGMVFSRDGKYLLMIGGVPDFKISIFDVELNKKIVMPETKLPCKPEDKRHTRSHTICRRRSGQHLYGL